MSEQKSVGLCMIVRNEEFIIRDCIDSTRPLIDYAMIVDTGSVDGTLDRVEEYFTEWGVGSWRSHPWKNFGLNRTRALQEMRELTTIDYVLMMDADDRLIVEPGFDVQKLKEHLDADLYNVKIRYGGTEYWRPCLMRNDLEFSYKGIVHEFLDGPPREDLKIAELPGIYIQANVAQGFRSCDPEKYRKDAALLREALVGEMESFLRARYTFYLAQSYRDSGEPKKALRYYLKRSKMPHWDQEIYVSLIEAGKLMQGLGYSPYETVDAFRRAIKLLPQRAEAYYWAARFCRAQQMWPEARDFAKEGLEKGDATHRGLFVEGWIGTFGLLDEFAISSYYTGDHKESLEACIKLVMTPGLPENDRLRIGQNAKFAVDALWGT